MDEGWEGRIVPIPPSELHVTIITVPAGTVMHRIHSDEFLATQFNPGLRGNARFSPIKDAQGNRIPTLYAGTSFECAAMETVFHDVPFAPGLKNYAKGKLEAQLHSKIASGSDLTLVDLTNKPLRKLGVRRAHLIETEKDQYPYTRLWAEAIYAQCPDVQGLYWVSRQDDQAYAVMLFGERLPEGTLHEVGAGRSLLQDELTYSALLDLADLIGVNIVPGKF